MSSRWIDRARHALTFRLALWYSVLFVVSASALVAIAYLLLTRTLSARDHELIESTLRRYAGEFEVGGFPSLDRAIAVDRVEGRHERLLVRVMGRGTDAVFVNIPRGWRDYDLERLGSVDGRHGIEWTTLGTASSAVLEVASIRLSDDTLVQVGRSSDVRDEVLEQFRARVEIVFAFICAIALAGGAAITYVGLAPIRAMASTVRTIVQTGRLEERVAVGEGGDALDELGALVNGMLDRIQALVGGMRGALDNVAHDLRTPLARLRSVAEGALVAGSPEAAREGLARALEEVERVSAMLTTLMDISEAETGAMKLARDPVPVETLVDDACSLYADIAEDKGLTIATRVAPGLELVADRQRLRQVVANLLDNAIKYTPPGGRITVEAQETSQQEIVLTVRDTGIGIAADEAERVFERLYRADASRSERGLGLGLSLVKAVVEAHGGRVKVESAPGQGSAFIVTLPRGSA